MKLWYIGNLRQYHTKMKKSITGDGVPTIFATISTGNGGWARCLRQYECILTVFEAKTKENKKKAKTFMACTRITTLLLLRVMLWCMNLKNQY